VLIATSFVLPVAATNEARGAEAQAAVPATTKATPKKTTASPSHEAARPRPKAHARAKKAQVGTASYYGAKHRGKKTASGERFNDRGLTAAHPSLPLDSKAKVTDLKTGRSVDVTITDRGPHKRGRVIDLSARAAEQIGMDKKKGVDPVKVEPIAEGRTPDNNP